MTSLFGKHKRSIYPPVGEVREREREREIMTRKSGTCIIVEKISTFVSVERERNKYVTVVKN